MANSITGIGLSSNQQTDSREVSGASKPEAQATSPSGRDVASASQTSDSTELSNVAAIMAASRQAASRPTFRPELVASLRAQIASGSYRPDPDQVAASVAAAIRS